MPGVGCAPTSFMQDNIDYYKREYSKYKKEFEGMPNTEVLTWLYLGRGRLEKIASYIPLSGAMAKKKAAKDTLKEKLVKSQ